MPRHRSYNLPVRYEGRIYRPPSKADALIVQATIGCSYNHCTYCDMYRDKTYRVRALDQVLAGLGGRAGDPRVEKVFVGDGDALGMPVEHWTATLAKCRASFPR